MRRLPRGPTLLSIALATALFAQTAAATDLLEVWRAAAQNDKTYAVDSAAHSAAQPRRDQAAALWKPRVGLTASVGIATSETDAQGAQFSAPGLGQSNGVAFSTSSPTAPPVAGPSPPRCRSTTLSAEPSNNS